MNRRSFLSSIVKAVVAVPLGVLAAKSQPVFHVLSVHPGDLEKTGNFLGEKKVWIIESQKEQLKLIKAQSDFLKNITKKNGLLP